MNPSKRILPTAEELKSVFHYDPETGEFLNKTDRARTPKAMSGMVAGYISKSHGYRMLSWKNNALLGHRVAWTMHYGEWPIDEIDHINNIRFDNRIANLRQASKEENNRNKVISRRNTSGIKGVTWLKSRQKWVAKICFKRKHTTIGYFTLKEKAAEAYAEAAHRLHGEFARLE
jgi:hypothetical protein